MAEDFTPTPDEISGEKLGSDDPLKKDESKEKPQVDQVPASVPPPKGVTPEEIEERRQVDEARIDALRDQLTVVRDTETTHSEQSSDIVANRSEVALNTKLLAEANIDTEDISQQSPLAELPQLDLEKVMGKVRDINTPGTAFTKLTISKTLDSVLETGLLGHGEVGPRRTINKSTDKQDVIAQWKKEMKEDPSQTFVYFNIIGEQGIKKIADSSYLRGGRSNIHDGLIIIFDVARLHEGEAKKYSEPDNYVEDENGWLIDPGDDEINSDDDKEDKHEKELLQWLYPRLTLNRLEYAEQPDAEGTPSYGYILRPRVAPRFFRGIILYKGGDGIDQDNLDKQQRFLEDMKKQRDQIGWLTQEERDMVANDLQTIEKINPSKFPEQYSKWAEEIAYQMMHVYQKNLSSCLPIYDVNGNLLWPRKISHEKTNQ